MAATPTQLKVLRFVRTHLVQHGYPPSVREIQSAFGFASPDAAAKHPQGAGRAGTCLPARTARGIRLIGGGSDEDALHLPLIGRVAAGAPVLVEANVERTLRIDQALFKPEPDYLLRIQGDSMVDAGIADGNLIAVRQTPEARNGQIVVARIDDAFTVKVFKRDRCGVHLLPRNPFYAPIEVDASCDFAIEGLYCGLVRGARHERRCRPR